VPLVADALASLECEIVDVHAAGDHWIVVARIDELHVSDDDDPLIFFAGRFRALAASQPLPD